MLHGTGMCVDLELLPVHDCLHQVRSACQGRGLVERCLLDWMKSSDATIRDGQRGQISKVWRHLFSLKKFCEEPGRNGILKWAKNILFNFNHALNVGPFKLKGPAIACKGCLWLTCHCGGEIIN
eukprot:15344320-Ditylum_brightwellii.AAC.1